MGDVSAPAGSPSAPWLRVAEKGTRFGVRLLLVTAKLLGRRFARLILRFVALYYAIGRTDARWSSAAYLARITGKPATLAMVWRHLLTFAEVSFDRICFLRSDDRCFEVVSHGGIRHLQALRDSGRGGILLGAHFGAFEAMRARAEARDLPIHPLVYLRNAPMINALLREISPKLAARLIEINPSSPASMLGLLERIEAGQILAIMGDRLGFNDKRVAVDFLGAPALFPTGPYLLAACLKCPVYFAAGIYTPPNRYDFHCEPLFERIELPRQGRDIHLAHCAQQYASRLEQCCRLAPYNWFNFFDFWCESPPSAS